MTKNGDRARRVAAVILLLLAGVFGIELARDLVGRQSEKGAGRRVPRGRSSVLLITLDTTRADHLQPYGSSRVETPIAARLAEEGVLFERAYSVAPITLVAHTSIHSGLYPPQHAVRNNGIHSVPDRVTTLAERLGERGYRTAAFVSAAVLERRYNLHQGFELYDDDLSTGRERHPRMVPDRPAEATVDAAVDWLDQLGDDETFLLWVHLYDPHAPYSPPPPFRDTYREDLYGGEIAYVDEQIGRLLEHRRLSTAADTLVTLIGDHGESRGEHGEQTHAILAYDSTLHVPWLLRIPGGPAALRIPTPVSQVDLMPTLLDLLNVEEPDETAGVSLVSLLEGRLPDRERGLYAETYLPYYTYGWAKLKSWRHGLVKYIEAPGPELYDLRRDPHELTNRLAAEPGLGHDMARDLDEFLSGLGADPEEEAELALDAEAMEKLRSLGYLAVGSAPPGPDAGQRRDPKTVIALHTGLERARTLSRDRLFGAAIHELRQVLGEDPTNLAALSDLAAALGAEGNIEEAVAVAERVLAADPDYVQIRLQLAALETRRGHHRQALALLDSALELDPNRLQTRIQRAQLLARVGRNSQAEAELTEALEEFQDDARLHTVYAQMVEMRRGDLRQAEERLRGAVERDPFLTQGWRLLGEVVEQQGDLDDAEIAYRRGLRTRPDDAALHTRLGLLLARGGGGAETMVHLREAIRLSETMAPDLHVALGGWLAENGRLSEARNEYDRVLAEYPRHAGARNNLAIALYRGGALADAEAVLHALVDERPQLADPWNNLAAVAIDRQDWIDAERYVRRSLELDETVAPAWNNLGIALEEQAETDDAEHAYQTALTIDPEYWPARLNLGLLLSRRGAAGRAAQLLEAVVAQVPAQPDAHLELGGLYTEALADPKRARDHYNAFLRHAPAHPRAAEALRQLTDLTP